jgi:hypothetical protein
VGYPFVQERYLLCCLPATLLLSTSGVVWILNTPRGGRLPAALAGASLLLFISATQPRSWNRYAGLRDVGDYLRGAVLSSPGRRVLISSTSAGEGALIAEVAIRETRPYSFLLRGSKMLARSTSIGEHYHLLYETDLQLLGALDELRVDYVLIDSFGYRPHDRLVQRAIRSAGADWALVQTIRRLQPDNKGQREFSLYRRSTPFVRPARELEVDLSYTLGRPAKRPPVHGAGPGARLRDGSRRSQGADLAANTVVSVKPK